MPVIAIALIILVVFVVTVAVRSIRIVPQARVVIVQRLGRYLRTASSGPVFVVPFMDKILPVIDLREQVFPLEPLPVITEDNVGIQIATVVYYQIVNPKAATYEVVNLLQAFEQLTMTTLRNIIGNLTLDKTLTSREAINSQMRAVLDEVTEKWGVRVNRVELKDIIPPHDVQQAMEKQMQAERNRRAAILLADGQKQSAVLQAEGEKQSAILKAEGAKQAAVLKAEGDAQALVTVQQAQAQAINVVFSALHNSEPSPEILKYLYLQVLPKMAEGSANKLFVLPSELENIAGLGATFAAATQQALPADVTTNGSEGRQ
ncbi:MAG TPA: SPFH domain-containing protein [Chloroflexota bacterium]|nr:SPFH domain-containing protein [Chloroflexota bacterium]